MRTLPVLLALACSGPVLAGCGTANRALDTTNSALQTANNSGGSGESAPAGGCTTDVECKGDRICENGACTAPPATAGGSPPMQVEPAGPASADGRVVTGPPDPNRAAHFARGDRVRCRWKNGGREYSGTVAGIADGRLLIDYDDGDKEAITPALCSRDGADGLGNAPPGGGAGGYVVVTGQPDIAGVARFPAGSRVRCRWKNGPREYSGTVRGSDAGRLLVDYDDGDKEAISPRLCRAGAPAIAGRVTTGNPDPAGAARFGRGARVSCRWKNGPREYTGTVAGSQGGYLLVDYDDGDKEAITASLCRPL